MEQKGYTVLHEPLDLKKSVDESNRVSGVVPITLNEMIGVDHEVFLDTLSEKLIGSCMLSFISYKVVGHDGDTIHFLVEGDAEPSVLED